MREQPRWVNSLIGLGAIGCAVTGVAGLLLALVSFLGGNLLSAGVGLVAAALAFALLLLALLRR